MRRPTVAANFAAAGGCAFQATRLIEIFLGAQRAR
jgi:hypothetical protein